MVDQRESKGLGTRDTKFSHGVLDHADWQLRAALQIANATRSAVGSEWHIFAAGDSICYSPTLHPCEIRRETIILTHELTSTRICMSFFDGGPLGPWPEENKSTGEFGCAFPFLGFVVFVVVVSILWQVFFD